MDDKTTIEITCDDDGSCQVEIIRDMPDLATLGACRPIETKRSELMAQLLCNKLRPLARMSKDELMQKHLDILRQMATNEQADGVVSGAELREAMSSARFPCGNQTERQAAIQAKRVLNNAIEELLRLRKK